MKAFKITWKHTGLTDQRVKLKDACSLSGVNYQTVLNYRSTNKSRGFENRYVKIEEVELK